MLSSDIRSKKLPTADCHREEENDVRWFTEEIQSHDGQLKAYLRNTYPAVRDIDDVVQESYLRVWQRHLARPVTSAKNFLFSVARHLALDLLRHERASPIHAVTNLTELPIAGEASTVEEACTQEEVALLLEAIDTLPARCREILILRKLQGLSQKEIARQLGLSEQTVQVQIGRGSRRCEAFLRERGVIRGSRP